MIDDHNSPVKVKTVSEDKDKVAITYDSFILKTVDIDDHRALKLDKPELAASALGHAISEYYEDSKMQCQSLQTLMKNFNSSHASAEKVEGDIMGDFNGYWQAPRTELAPTYSGQTKTLHIVYSTVQYDIALKTGVTGLPTQMAYVIKIPLSKSEK